METCHKQAAAAVWPPLTGERRAQLLALRRISTLEKRCFSVLLDCFNKYDECCSYPCNCGSAYKRGTGPLKSLLRAYVSNVLQSGNWRDETHDYRALCLLNSVLQLMCFRWCTSARTSLLIGSGREVWTSIFDVRVLDPHAGSNKPPTPVLLLLVSSRKHQETNIWATYQKVSLVMLVTGDPGRIATTTYKRLASM